MSERIYIPALRGRLGDWAYYATLMTLDQVSNKIDYAKDIHESRGLSELIQRELRGPRAQEIANYLITNEDRFFNSLVVAIYGGTPGWHELDIKTAGEEVEAEDLSDTALYSIGYLSLTQSERIFALDGQHRLAGIQNALKNDPALGAEELSVIFVAHHNTAEGLRRTRKLFTTLNKQAKPVQKSEIIALDESDVMAIVTRHLVETHAFFKDGRIDAMRKQASLPTGDTKHFTTIVNLYDVLCVALPHIKSRLSADDARNLRIYRPSDDELTQYIEFGEAYFESFATHFPALAEYFNADDGSQILRKYRIDEGGHVLFRPIGLKVFSEILKELRRTMSFAEAMAKLSNLPVELSKPPYRDTVWNPHRRTVNTRNAPVCRDVLLYMLGRGPKEPELRKRYARTLEVDENVVQLPEQI